MKRFLATSFTLVAGALVLAQQQQPDTEAVARALVTSLAPERDDPDAAIRSLVETALARGDKLGALLLREAIARTDALQSPAQLLALLPAEPAPAIRLPVAHLRLRLQAAAGVTGPLVDPWAGDASSLLVVGPFGDHGDHWNHVPFPPEARFPRLGEALAGRGRTVTARVLVRETLQRTVNLTDPKLVLSGCWYALHRVRTDNPVVGFAEVECANGAFELFVNGRIVASVDPALTPGTHARHAPVRFLPGENHVVLKTCTNGAHVVALRYVGADGGRLDGLVEVDASAEPAPHVAPDDAGAPVWDDGLAALLTASQSSEWALAAAAAVAQRLDREEDLLALADIATSAQVREPQPALVLAGVLRAASDLPEEQRRARAAQLEELALAALPTHHHAAVRARVRQLEDADQREQAVRLLRAQAEAGHAGPATYSSWQAALRRLRFTAEEQPLLAAWAAACPGDPRPRGMTANLLASQGNARGAVAQLRAALAARPDHEPAAQSLFQMALDCQDEALAREALDAWFPANRFPGEPPLQLLMARAALARRLGDEASLRSALEALGASPAADADIQRALGERLLQLGDDAAALAAWDRSLALRGDQFGLRAVVAGVAGPEDPWAHFARFRRDGLAAARAHQSGPQDASAPTTAVLDQMIVEVFPDGSQVQEVHMVRRVNDLAGVEATKDAREAAAADELLLIRTLGTDGTTATPVRLDEGFSMTRLEPGAFVEFRYRNHRASTRPDPQQPLTFLFRSEDEPYGLSELVLVLHEDSPGELRTRGLDAPSEELDLGDGRRALVFRAEKVDRLPTERATPPVQELVPVAGWGEDGAMGAVARASRRALVRATRPSLQVRRTTEEALAGVEDPAAKVLALHEHCHREVRDGSSSSPTETVLRGQGDRFGLFVSMLRAAGIPHRLGFAEGEREELGSGEAPLFDQDDPFQVPCAVVPVPGREPLWFFADAPRYYPAGWVQGSRFGARALLCDEDGFELVRVPQSAEAWSQSFTARGTATVGNRGNVTLDVEVSFAGAAGFGIADALRERPADEQKQISRQVAQQLLPGWQLSLAEARDLEPVGKPVVFRVRATRRALQQAADGKTLLQLPLPRGSYVPSFGDRSKRTLPMRLPAELHARWEVELVTGPDLEVANLPGAVVVSEGTFDYGLVVRPGAKGLRIERTFSLRPTTIPPQRFGDWMRALAAADRGDETVVELRATR
ncbi:MAG: hypothetical protein RL148_1893 [Planctomycetota bacterium]